MVFWKMSKTKGTGDQSGWELGSNWIPGPLVGCSTGSAGSVDLLN